MVSSYLPENIRIITEPDKETLIENHFSGDNLIERIETETRQDGSLLRRTYDNSGRHIATSYNLFDFPQTHSQTSMNVAIVGDLHGHISLALRILKEWQTREKRTIDAILQVGDFGAYTQMSVLDKVTAELAEKDSDELGFFNYLKQTNEADEFFHPNNGFFRQTPLYFVRGNHEDFDFLQGKTSRDLLSYYSNIHLLSDGEVVSLNKSNLEVKISGIGGLEPRDKPQPYDFKRKDLEKLSSTYIDILLSHQPPKTENNPKGSQMITDLVNRSSARYHFCGHIHNSGLLSSNTNTHSYLLNEVNFTNRRQLKKNSIGILEINKEMSNFNYITNYWLKNIKKIN